jgi:hypothetical protein
VFIQRLHAQNANSIYSAYGIGDVNIRDINAYSPMGGVGVALKSERTLNELNPASYSGLTNYRHILEIAAIGSSVNYVSANNNLQATDFNIRRAAFGMNLFKHVGTVFGISKYSLVSYQTSGTRSLQGSTTSLDEKIKGSGGINRAFFSNSLAIGKHLSIGVSTGLLFGSVNKKEIIGFNSSGGIIVDNNDYYNHAFINSGIQYSFKTGKFTWMAGGTYQPAMNLNRQITNQITDLSAVVLKGTTTTNTTFRYPSQFSGGISVKRGGSLLAFDYIQQNWKVTGYSGNGFTTTNLKNFALGYSYTSYKNGPFGKIERASILAGFQHDLSYVILNGKQVETTAGSLGVNLPGKSGAFNYTLGVRAGQRGEVAYPLVKEKFVELTFNISLAGLFYVGGRKYD